MISEKEMAALFSSVVIEDINVNCPCCGKVITSEDHAYLGLRANLISTLQSQLIVMEDKCARLNTAQHKEQILVLNTQIKETKQWLRNLGKYSIWTAEGGRIL
jgi:hypothetical protein